ncbi:MAG: hypothetical protein ACI4UA_05990, partial [Bacteroidaceae bacterium]
GSLTTPFTSAVFSNVTFIGPNGRDGFENNADYINGGSVFPQNGSALGKFQAAMHIRRSSHLSCFNSVAVGYPIGIIIDAQKGDTQEYAKAGNLKFQNIFFAGMDITGSDANKRYVDDLYDAVKGAVIDAGTESYSSTYFKAQPGNRVYAQATDLRLEGYRTLANGNVAVMPASDSPLLGAAQFTDSKLSSWFARVNYIGAFAAGDNWLENWTEFDPQQADY